MISIIAAIGKNNEIGKDNKMPWHLPNDLHYFKETTLNHPVIMGRKTYESIGRPLPKRKNIVISKQRLDLPDGMLQIKGIEDIKKLTKQYEQIFIIGGATIYEQTIDLADRLFITRINEAFLADTFFPKIDLTKWHKVSSKKGLRDKENDYDYEFIIYERIH